MTLALHVLTDAGFGKAYDFQTGVSRTASKGHELSFQDSLEVMLTHVESMTVLTLSHTPHFLLPRISQSKSNLRRRHIGIS